MNLRLILPTCLLLAAIAVAACGGVGGQQEPTVRRSFVTATLVPASSTLPATMTALPTSTSAPQLTTASPVTLATETSTSALIPTASLTPVPPTLPPPTRRPVIVLSPTPVVIDVDLSALLAQDASGAQKDPAAFALAFLPDERILHAVAKFSNVPAGTSVRAAWTAVDLAGAVPPNTQLGETAFVAGGTPNLDFGIPTFLGSFLPGKYKVEIWFDDRLDTVLNFGVNAAPDVYVTALEVQPSSPKRGQGVTFVATFLNTTGGPRAYDWLVLIFRPGQTKSMGESAHVKITVDPGSAKFTIANSWHTGVGECEPFVAQPYFRDADKNRFPFKGLDGNIVSTGFSVCP